MFDYLFSSLLQHGESNSKTSIRCFCAGDGLKKKVHGSSATQCGKLSGNVRQTTTLRRDLIHLDQTFESAQYGTHGLNRIGGRIHTDHCVATSIKRAFKGGKQDSANIISRMVRLHADSQYPRL